MNAIVTTQANLPAHLAGRKSGYDLGSALSGGLSQASFPRISIKGGRFRIVIGSSEEILENRTLRCILVGSNPGVSKSFYKDKWDPKADTKAPDCFSMDGIRPSPEAEHPQAQLCAGCPQNVYGSKMNEAGNKVKACSDQKRLAVVAAEAPDGDVYLLQVTPAALKGFGEYVRLLQHKGFPPECVITEVSFDPNESYPKMQFSFGGFISEDVVPIIDDLMGSQRVLEVTGEVTAKAEVVNTTQARKPAVEYIEAEVLPPPPPPPPAPVVESVPVENAAPAKKRGFGTSAAAPVEQAKPTQAREVAETAPSVPSSKLTDELKGILSDLE